MVFFSSWHSYPQRWAKWSAGTQLANLSCSRVSGNKAKVVGLLPLWTDMFQKQKIMCQDGQVHLWFQWTNSQWVWPVTRTIRNVIAQPDPITSKETIPLENLPDRGPPVSCWVKDSVLITCHGVRSDTHLLIHLVTQPTNIIKPGVL